jgi:signal peptidase I
MLDLGAPQAPLGAPEAPEDTHLPKQRSKLARWFDSWMRSVGMAVVLFLIVRTFLVEAFQIPSGSMERTLLIGDFLFVNKAVYGAQIPGTHSRLPGFESPKRGDVIVFAYPKAPDTNFVKRIIGMGGDTLQMVGGSVLVNGVRQVESYVQRTDRWHNAYEPDFEWQRAYLADTSILARAEYRPRRDDWGPLVVPSRKYFVLGDNRDISADSRYWGFVDETAVKGRPLIIYWSCDKEAHDPLPCLTDIRWSRLGSLIH